MKLKIMIFTILLSLSSNAFAAKMRIAVVDLKPYGISKNIAQQVSELIRIEIINTNKFLVIERSQMSQLLKEQGFQQTGCTDVSCAVKMGKLLSANKMLVGTIMKLGGDIIITGRIVDVEKGVAEISEKHKVGSTKGLFGAVSQFTYKLTNKIGRPSSGYNEYSVPGKEPFYPYSRVGARFGGLVPVYSGSWRVGFTKFGFLLVAAKTIGMIGVIKTASEETSTTYSYEEQTPEEEQEEKDREKRLQIYAYMWVFGTLIDMIYSPIRIHNYNEKHMKKQRGARDSSSGTLLFAISPRFSNTDRFTTIKTDGVNFSLMIAF